MYIDANFTSDGTLDQHMDWIPGMPNMRLRDFPSFIRITDLNDAVIIKAIQSETNYTLHQGSSILINTFDELEHQVLDVLKQQNPNIYTIGPLHLLSKQMPLHDYFNTTTPSLWKEDQFCLNWLDKRETNSVMYVNYGSIATMSNETLLEFAYGLANCGYSFLWVVRPDVLESNAIPREYFEEIKERGLVVSWCDQEKVLSHSSIGLFLSHCGWNSTLESMSLAGKAILCWPFSGEQPTNSRYICSEWFWCGGWS